MASGGRNTKNPKTSASEPRQRSSWQRTTSMSDRDDNVSLNSFTNDLRPNNWDFSDWRPSGSQDQTKRRKKGNPEWEREQSLIVESPPPSERKHGTPRTFPRTKMTPTTPTSQRLALENLRQQMTFSDQEDGVSTDGDRERNNERNLLRRRENVGSNNRQAERDDPPLSRPVPNQRDDRNNRNNKQNEAKAAAAASASASSDKVDSSQIVSRLMQIRDYIKQASSMMDTLRKSGDPPGMREEVNRLQKLMDHLKEQEREYTSLLQTILSVHDGPDVNGISREMTPNQADGLDDTTSVDLDVQSEVSDREERSISASSRPRIEDHLGLTSDNDEEEDEEDIVENGAPSESSNNSSTMDDTVIANRGLPVDYEELAAVSGQNQETVETLVALRQQQELLQKLVDQQEQMRALRSRQAALLSLQQEAEAKLASTRQKSNEARAMSNALDQAAIGMTSTVDALTSADNNTGRPSDPDLFDIRQQLQYLRNELKTQDQNHQQPETQPSQRKNQPNQKKSQPKQQRAASQETRLKNVPPPRPPSPKLADRPTRQAPPAQVTAPVAVPDQNIPAELLTKEQLQARLHDLLNKKNRLDKMLQEEFSVPLVQRSDEMTQDQLAGKLQELQNKKGRMDDMLRELQSLRANPAFTLNNAARSGVQPPVSQPQGAMAAPDPVSQSTESTENLTNGVLEMLDARQKLQKLNEVKGRLSQLKSLVHFYQQAGPDGRPGEEEDQSSIPAYREYGTEHEVSRDRSTSEPSRQGVRPQQVNIPVQIVEQLDSDENNGSSSSSSSSSTDGESESQMSSLGPWGDDPEIQEKVRSERKLKAAKDKLKHLQSLVSMVQTTPGMADGLSDNLAELAASLEDDGEMEEGEDRNNATLGEREPPALDQEDRDTYYQTKMEEQLEELEDLRNEKDRLLSLQSQLQTLHHRFKQSEEDKQTQDSGDDSRPKSPTNEESINQEPNPSTGQQNTQGPSVTFSSNEEVYYKMRNQRMMREELREKKKQLESIMKKDRNKKQYYRNQDNQSDTVSYSTELFGANASVDQTMATWGGSTVDNMESITEDGAGQDNNEDDEEDDAYPIDGILQVEEEEEENQSDNETYTIEDDVRQRRKARTVPKGDNTEGGPATRKGNKANQSFPRSMTKGGARAKEVWTKPTDFNKWSRSGRKSRQESAEEIVQEAEENPRSKSVIKDLQRQLEETNRLCQSLLAEQQSGQLARQAAAGFGSHSQLSDFQQQLQQQQLMMSLNQCYQQINLQQAEMQNMQRQVQALMFQQSDSADLEGGLSGDVRTRSMSSLYSPLLPRQSPSLLLPPDPFSFNSPYMHMSPMVDPRLLRRASDMEQTGRGEISDSGERQRRLSRNSRTDSYTQKSKRKSQSQSPQQTSSSQVRSKGPVQELYEEGVEEEEEENQFSPDRQKFEDYLARKKREFMERNKLQDKSPKPTKDTGQRSSFSGLNSDQYRPGLSAGISGAGYMEDGRSVVSSVQSSVAAVSQANQADRLDIARESDEDPGEMSLFETLRETIYSEVATLISQNENRPHYLIELFRELQLLTTDYLRQRVLYDIKDVVSKYLVEDNAVSAPPPSWLTSTAQNYNTAELTPSESIVTSDDEEVKYLLQMKLKQKVAANLVAKERERNLGNQVSRSLLRSGSMKNDKYDYQEQAEVASSVSTPSNSYWESPFNQDSLGETAIHLDKTLKKMKEYEERLTAQKDQLKERSRGEQSRNEQSRVREERLTDLGEVSSSAMDQGDESSVNSDTVPYPRIDTQQLDQQIKSIMTEVIPVIKEHMDNMCSPQLLAYIKRLVLSLTRQYDGGQEFARFFHRQLGSILQDSLAKYEGRKMRECGEDLLVDMSEVLFNELAFFRLMQDLDDPLITEKMKKAQALDSENDDEDDFDKDNESDDESDTTETTANASDNQDDTRPTHVEEEDLGKARDDELANEIEICDAEDKDDETESPYKGVQIQLAPSETKPYTRIGSDEDDESATDESQSNEDPSETAVSITARRTDRCMDEVEGDGARGDSTDTGAGPSQEEEGPIPAPVTPTQVTLIDQGRDADQGASNGKTEEAELMNGDILNGDMEVITMDDLPPALNVMSSEELQCKLLNEEQANSVVAAMSEVMEGQEELAGDPQFLKEPDEASG
ncbi:pericentriolar material 1 protein-like isoform X3 [Mya arenaria]|uniref:pericentriolar material 1 protein-like isoform X3 n=1 Tax=Mya arenaria TaxID=6604 RepID=UPI0022E48772|nr:pericentriolar material 1 protein-like isoform X3 [Mya arenaria]